MQGDVETITASVKVAGPSLVNSKLDQNWLDAHLDLLTKQMMELQRAHLHFKRRRVFWPRPATII
jgi:hypothetical protein